MRFSISETAKWGDVSVGPRIIDASVRRGMKIALKEIQNGKFAKGWVKEYETGYKRYNKLMKDGEKHNIEKVGAPIGDVARRVLLHPAKVKMQTTSVERAAFGRPLPHFVVYRVRHFSWFFQAREVSLNSKLSGDAYFDLL